MVKRNLGLAILGLVSLGTAAQADSSEVLGRYNASLRFTWGTGEVYEIDVRDEGDKVVGRNTLSRMQLINLDRIPGGYSGVADGTTVRVTCEEMKCSGMVGSGNVNVTLSQVRNGYRYRGSVNFVPVTAIQSDVSIEVSADASFKATGNMGKYRGRGAGRGPRSTFDIVVKGSGTLANGGDPALFILTTIAPFVRNNL